MQPFFSIIIPTLNEEVNLPILLESLAKQTYRDFEVIVSDSNSEDKTREKALSFSQKLPKLIFIAKPKRNVSIARNNGAKAANGEYLVFLDADVKIEEKFLEGIKKHIKKDKVKFLTLWNRSESKKLIGKVIFALLNSLVTLFAKIKPSVNGPCMVVEWELFRKTGGFDPEIIFGEDSDFAQKVHSLGERLRVYQKPIIYVSMRRFEKEGFLKSTGKSIYAFFYDLIFGPIKKPIFDYEMGGQYYKKNQTCLPARQGSKIKDQN